MAYSDYITELTSPQLKLHDDGTMPSPCEIEEYLSTIEQKRQEFISFVADKDESRIGAFLGEMNDAIKVIEKRGFVQLRNDDLVTAVIGGVEGAQSFLSLKSIDSRLYASAKKTVEFLNALLGESTTPQHTIPEPKEEVQEEELICGVTGLAKFLHIGTTKAQAIINSKILTKTKPAIQFSAGGWRFSKKGLQEFLTNNPAAFSKIKCPH